MGKNSNSQSMPKDPKERVRVLDQMAQKLGHVLLTRVIPTVNTKLEIFCTHCGITSHVVARKYFSSKVGTRCCNKRLQQQAYQQQAQASIGTNNSNVTPNSGTLKGVAAKGSYMTQQKCDQIAASRGHRILVYPKRSKDLVTVECLTHNTIQTKRWDQYQKQKTGMQCCGKELSARTRNPLGTAPTRKRQSHRTAQDNSWREKIKKRDGNQCVVSGEVHMNRNLSAHHLYSSAHYESVRYRLENGILISQKLHQQYHDSIGKYNKATAESFIEFLEQYKNKLLTENANHPHLNGCNKALEFVKNSLEILKNDLT